jgi:hypothetical protein
MKPFIDLPLRTKFMSYLSSNDHHAHYQLVLLRRFVLNPIRHTNISPQSLTSQTDHTSKLSIIS